MQFKYKTNFSSLCIGACSYTPRSHRIRTGAGEDHDGTRKVSESIFSLGGGK